MEQALLVSYLKGGGCRMTIVPAFGSTVVSIGSACRCDIVQNSIHSASVLIADPSPSHPVSQVQYRSLRITVSDRARKGVESGVVEAG